jgi:pimeloyl-ACP methyl ester carboxylesterase
MNRASVVVIALASLAACGDGDPAAVTADRCRVDLHGKGDRGADAAIVEGIAILRPDGNGEGWGAREWRYDDPDDRATAVAIVRDAVDAAGCERVAIHGFSNGAAFAASLACSGGTLDGRLVGVVIDDPVTDAATLDCRAGSDVQLALYWTGALDAVAPPGTDCTTIDWTCAGGTVRGIDAFATDLGVSVTPSPFDEHRRFDDAPEPTSWLSG